MDPRRSGLFLARSICRRCRTGYGRADFTSLAGNDDTLCLGADPGEHGTCLGSGQAPIARRSRRSGSGATNDRMFIRDVTLGLSFPKCVQYAHSGKFCPMYATSKLEISFCTSLGSTIKILKIGNLYSRLSGNEPFLESPKSSTNTACRQTHFEDMLVKQHNFCFIFVCGASFIASSLSSWWG
jgi:hypothetical protein